MKTFNNSQPCQYEISESDKGDMTLQIQSNINALNASAIIREMRSILQDRLPHSLTVDLGKVTYLDDYGVLALVELREIMIKNKGNFRLDNTSDKVKEILSILHFESLGKKVSFLKKRPPGIFIRLGDATFRVASDVKYLVSFIGSVLLSLLYVCVHPKSL